MGKKLSCLLFLSISSTFCVTETEKEYSKKEFFQQSLLDYLEKQKEESRKKLSKRGTGNTDLSDNVVAFVIRLIQNKQDPTINIEENAVSLILEADKFAYLDNLIKKLDQCVLYNPPYGVHKDDRLIVTKAKYTNEEYIKSWNVTHPHDIKVPESQFIFSLIQGFTINKNTSEKHEFSLNLKNIDIPTIFETLKNENTALTKNPWDSQYSKKICDNEAYQMFEKGFYLCHEIEKSSQLICIILLDSKKKLYKKGSTGDWQYYESIEDNKSL